MKKPSRFLSLLASTACFLSTISFAISVPILCRPFYYFHISFLKLPQSTGWSSAQIREAFDSVMNYLLLGSEFSTGILRWSTDGRDHFADCRFLFRLNFSILALSLMVLILLVFFTKTNRIRLHHFAGFPPCFFGALTNLILFAALAVWGSLSFSTFFTAFHKLFFPGESNWIFHPAADEIILVLPQRFFLNCAILIFIVILLIDLFCLLHGFRLRNQSQRQRI